MVSDHLPPFLAVEMKAVYNTQQLLVVMIHNGITTTTQFQSISTPSGL